MKPKNKVFIATSIDGFIADRNGSIEWLETYPDINTIDTGYEAFTSDIEALLMGHNTYKTLCGFDIEWPYKKPVFILSNSRSKLEGKFKNDVVLIGGSLSEVLNNIHERGYHQLYIDGGKVIQSFLEKDLVDELVITIIPVILGGGIPLFSMSPKALKYECFKIVHYLDVIAQSHYRRIR